MVLDTHAWLWWVSDPGKLSATARAAIDRAATAANLVVSSISAWEVDILVKKGRLVLTMDVQDWVRKSEALPALRFKPVDNSIAVRCVN
ncbi:MAG: PIN domain-containing protein, partial [Deferrisomatales bacterium]